jgi:hypothetical protein
MLLRAERVAFSCNLLAEVRTICAELALPPVAELAAPPDISVDELAAALHHWTSRPDPVTVVMTPARAGKHVLCEKPFAANGEED